MKCNPVSGLLFPIVSGRFISGSFLLFIVLVFGNIHNVHGQAFEVLPSDEYPFEPVFTKDYILQNRIRTITAEIVLKRDDQPIDDRGLRKCWEYDSTGLLKRFYSTTIRGFVNREVQHPAIYRRGRRISGPYTTQEPVYNYDTTFTNYIYNKQQQIIIRRVRDGDYYNTTYFEYDSTGNVRKQSVFRETNASENKSEFRLGVQNLISVEEFVTQKLSPVQIKRKHLNDEGKVYKQTILNYDSLGRLINEDNSFTVSWMRSSVKLKYDSAGCVSERQAMSNENGDEFMKSEYKYVDGKYLDVEKRYKGNELYYEYNFIYDRKSHQLNSHFVREFLSKSIVISKYVYVTYP